MEIVLKYVLFSFIISMLWAPFLINSLYKLKVVRHVEKDFSTVIGERYLKAGTPIMGGLLVVVTTIFLTLIFNRHNITYVPIAVLLIASILGGIDDLLNIFGRVRVIRPIKKQLRLARVHKSFIKRIYYWCTIPWNAYKNIWYALGSYPGSGIHAGEKIIVQVIIGSIVAWWLWWNLGWDSIWVPYYGQLYLGYLMPLFIIFTVTSMANAVNIADGMDGLSSGMLIPAFSAFMLISMIHNLPELAILCAVITGSLIAYLYFNIKPARFEMGDVGSLALGSVIAVIAFALDRSLLLPIIGFLFVAEIGSSLVQAIFRRVFGRRLFKMAPLHLHFQIKGWTEEKIVMRFWLFSGLFALIGVLIGIQ